MNHYLYRATLFYFGETLFDIHSCVSDNSSNMKTLSEQGSVPVPIKTFSLDLLDVGKTSFSHTTILFVERLGELCTTMSQELTSILV